MVQQLARSFGKDRQTHTDPVTFFYKDDTLFADVNLILIMFIGTARIYNRFFCGSADESEDESEHSSSSQIQNKLRRRNYFNRR